MLQRSIGILFAVLMFLTAIVLSTKTWGQAAKFEVIEINPTLLEPAAIKTMDRARKEAPRRREAAPGSWPQWNAFNAYYNKYLFPKMTQPDELTNLPQMRAEILKDLRVAQSSGASESARAIMTWSVANAGKLAKGNYHPAVRINATLLLAQLDDRASIPPVPAQAALSPLVGLYRDQAAPDGVRAAALIGLHRWTMYGLPNLSANARNGIVDMMLELANAPVPENRTAKGHAFLQRYALDMLRVLYSPPRSAEITQAFVNLSTSSEVSPIISLYATAKLSSLAEGAKVEAPTDVAKAWTANIANVFDSEHARLLAMTPPKAAASQSGPVQPRTRGVGGVPGARGSMGMEMEMEMMNPMGSAEMDMGGSEMMGSDAMMSEMMDPRAMGMGMGMGMGGVVANPQPSEVIASRRRLVHALECLQLGLTGSRTTDPPNQPAGLGTKFPAEQQLAVTQLNDAIQEVLEEVNNTEYDTRETFTQMLVSQARNLKTLSTHLGQEKAADAEAVDDSAFPAGPAFPGLFP
ncbi:hypothetical protein [Roseimaritima ulvae]|nr:hypothetical protein [Roseimaritima ulvae]